MKSSSQIYIHHQPADLPLDLRKLKYDRAHLAHSFVSHFLKFLFIEFNTISLPMVDIAGTPRTIITHANNLLSIPGAGVAWLGIVVGTGTTPPTPSDYAITALINTGVAPGQLQYGPQSYSNPWIATPNVYGAAHRTFVNGSGAPITVTELAFYVTGRQAAGDVNIMITKDVLSTPATINNGQAYRFIITFCTPVG
jgi:hypothetical protein